MCKCKNVWKEPDRGRQHGRMETEGRGLTVIWQYGKQCRYPGRWRPSP